MLKFSPIMLFNMLKLRPKFAYYKRYLLLLNAFWYHYSQNYAEINHRYTKPKQNCVVMCRQWESIANYNTPNPTKQAITRCLFCAIAKLFFISIYFFFWTDSLLFDVSCLLLWEHYDTRPLYSHVAAAGDAVRAHREKWLGRNRTSPTVATALRYMHADSCKIMR